MDRLEIATRIFCSGKADEISYAWQLAGELIVLDKELKKGLYDSLDKALNDDFLTDKDEANLSQRTADRTQKLIDLGFEADEDLILYKGETSISPKLIEVYNESEWNSFLGSINQINTEPTVQEIKQHQSESNPTVTFTETDFFKGSTYIEFEMPNTMLRLYRMDKQIEAENDLQVTKKADSKYIMTHAENKEFELGITIFKK